MCSESYNDNLARKAIMIYYSLKQRESQKHQMNVKFSCRAPLTWRRCHARQHSFNLCTEHGRYNLHYSLSSGNSVLVAMHVRSSRVFPRIQSIQMSLYTTLVYFKKIKQQFFWFVFFPHVNTTVSSRCSIWQPNSCWLLNVP